MTQLFQQALQALQSGVMILDEGLRVHFINPWLEQAFAGTQTLQGQALFDLYPTLQHSRIHRAAEQAVQLGLPSLLSPGLNRSPLPLYPAGDSSQPMFPQSIRVQPMQADDRRFCLIEVQDVSAMVRREALLNQQAETLNRMALTDELTGIANRRHLNQLLESALTDTGRQGLPLSLILFDIDFFKQYNDQLGHQAGDKCLVTIAGYLQQLASAEPQADSGALQVARYGGEEFCLILPGADLQAAAALAEQVRAGIEQLALPHPDSAVAQVVTASFGLAMSLAADCCQGHQETQTGLILKADNALYRAKMTGRNRVITAE